MPKTAVKDKTLKEALVKQCVVAEEILVRQIREGDIYKYNWYCFNDRVTRKPWETKDFQIEWHNEINKAMVEGYPGIVIYAPIEHGKSEQIVRSYVLREIGENPNIQIAIVSNVAKQASKEMSPIKQDIELNEHYKKVYPGIKPERRPGRNQKWTDTAITVQRDINSKDYTVEATGIHGAILGSRLDRIILVDPCDWENTLTPAQRESAIKWIASTLLGRLVEGGFVICIMTAWYEPATESDFGDIGYELIKNHGFKKLVYKAIKDDGTPLWPEKFSPARIEDMKTKLGYIEFNRQMLNKPLSDVLRIFKSRFFDKCLDAGKNFELVPTYTKGDLRLICGVDLATRKGKKNDLTAFFMIGVDSAINRRVLNIIARRMEFPEIIRTFEMLHVAFPGCLFIVEDNAAQIYVKQHLVHTTGIQVIGFTTTGMTKHGDIGIRSMSVDFENGKWIIPHHPECMAWIQEFLMWSPQAHTGDLVMASFFANSGINNAGGASVTIFDLSPDKNLPGGNVGWNRMSGDDDD